MDVKSIRLSAVRLLLALSLVAQCCPRAPPPPPLDSPLTAPSLLPAALPSLHDSQGPPQHSTFCSPSLLPQNSRKPLFFSASAFS